MRTTNDASSTQFGLPNLQGFPSLGSTMNGDDIRDEDFVGVML